MVLQEICTGWFLPTVVGGIKEAGEKGSCFHRIWWLSVVFISGFSGLVRNMAVKRFSEVILQAMFELFIKAFSEKNRGVFKTSLGGKAPHPPSKTVGHSEHQQGQWRLDAVGRSGPCQECIKWRTAQYSHFVVENHPYQVRSDESTLVVPVNHTHFEAELRWNPLRRDEPTLTPFFWYLLIGSMIRALKQGFWVSVSFMSLTCFFFQSFGVL